MINEMALAKPTVGRAWPLRGVIPTITLVSQTATFGGLGSNGKQNAHREIRTRFEQSWGVFGDPPRALPLYRVAARNWAEARRIYSPSSGGAAKDLKQGRTEWRLSGVEARFDIIVPGNHD